MNRRPAVLYVIGCVAILVGTLDPMEGSVLILAGSAVILGSVLGGKRPRPERMYWLRTFLLIAVGVGALWGWSAVGGIGGRSGHSMWWGLTMLPYPVGWWFAVREIVHRAIGAWHDRRHAEAQ
jgi:4-hydroxybenzoate polyprenyltransferase